MINEIVQSVQNLFGSRRIRKKPHVVTREEHGINRDHLSPFAISVCKKLQDAGYKAYIVGGAVRDLLIGHTPKDFDVATDATPEQVKRLTRRAIIIGRRFRLVHVIRGPEIIEVSTFRGLQQEGVEKDDNGRVIDDNVFGEQWEDAARRDFTVNAMYYDPSTEELLDYHGGMLDVRKKRIRMIGDPELRYREDPVRILRAIRISAKLGFRIDPKTTAPISEMQHLLMDVPEARLFDEMLKMLTSGAALECLDGLAEYGVDIQLPLLQPLLNSQENIFVKKALERCDARVHQGRSISPSFLFASILWSSVQKEHIKLSGKKLSPARRWMEACEMVLESPQVRGIQRRFHKDMREIWLLQPRFEKRFGASARRLLDHPRFRAAYDFMLIRASSGEIPHALADWWTAFESAPDDEREEMLVEIHSDKSVLDRTTPLSEEAVSEEKPKKKRRRKRKPNAKSRSDAPEMQDGETSGETIAPASEPAPAPAPTIETTVHAHPDYVPEEVPAPRRRRAPRKGSALLTAKRKPAGDAE